MREAECRRWRKPARSDGSVCKRFSATTVTHRVRNVTLQSIFEVRISRNMQRRGRRIAPGGRGVVLDVGVLFCEELGKVLSKAS